MPTNPSSHQSDASRRNGSRSSGPVTAEGKSRSSQNSIKLGLSAKAVVLPGESQAEFEALLQEYTDEFKPKTRSETDLIEELTVARWRLNRVRAASAQIGSDFLAAIQDERLATVLNNLHRWDVHYRRQYDRARKLLIETRQAAARAQQTNAKDTTSAREVVVRWVDDTPEHSTVQNEPDESFLFHPNDLFPPPM